jgi:hypothetical protein
MKLAKLLVPPDSRNDVKTSGDFNDSHDGNCWTWKGISHFSYARSKD